MGSLHLGESPVSPASTSAQLVGMSNLKLLLSSQNSFLGTGTSEGIPRVSRLTNPLKTCEVCSKAKEPGNKNSKLNTSILLQYTNSFGRCDILVDAGKECSEESVQNHNGSNEMVLSPGQFCLLMKNQTLRILNDQGCYRNTNSSFTEKILV